MLVWRFLATGGRAMLAMMGGGPDDMTGHNMTGHDGRGDHAHGGPT